MNVTIGGIARTVEITSFDKLGDVKVCMLTTTADGSVGFQQLNQEVVDTIYASFPVDTAKGDIASFEDGADNVPVRELKLNLEPYQNLNGYDSPWVGGAGVNKLSPLVKGVSLNATTGAQSTSATSATTDYIPVNFTTNPNYYISGILNTLYSWVGAYNSSKQFLGRTSASIRETLALTSSAFVSGTPQGSGDIAYLRFTIYENTGATGVIDDIDNMKTQLEIDSTATAWTPYENICPIYPANGKNLLENEATSKTVNGVTFTVNEDGSVLANGTASAQTDIFLFGTTWDDGIHRKKQFAESIIASIGVIGSSSTFRGVIWAQGSNYFIDTADVTIPANKVLYGMAIRIINGQTVNNVLFKPMLRPASISDSTYVPYNGIGITRTGKNLLSADRIFKGTIEDKTFTIVGSTSSVYRSAIIKLSQGSWTFTFPVNVNLVRLVKDGTFTMLTTNNVRTYTINTTTDGGVGISWRDATSSSTNWDDSSVTQLEKGSASTGIEPYTAERYYPISDNPIYGGTLDVTTGVLTVDRGYVVFDGTGWTMYTSGKFYSATDSLPQGNSGASVANMFISNLYPFSGKGDSNSSAITTDKHFYAQRSYHRAWVYDSSFTTLESFQAELSENNLQIVYPLASPLVYQLTPVQVKTLLGYNNIWTDSGTVEVQYRANVGLYIQKIIGATEDDMVANQNISANKYFFVGEELYYSTSAISAGQTIVVGTNCIKTNLADALNALNS